MPILSDTPSNLTTQFFTFCFNNNIIPFCPHTSQWQARIYLDLRRIIWLQPLRTSDIPRIEIFFFLFYINLKFTIRIKRVFTFKVVNGVKTSVNCFFLFCFFNFLDFIAIVENIYITCDQFHEQEQIQM